VYFNDENVNFLMVIFQEMVYGWEGAKPDHALGIRKIASCAHKAYSNPTSQSSESDSEDVLVVSPSSQPRTKKAAPDDSFLMARTTAAAAAAIAAADKLGIPFDCEAALAWTMLSSATAAADAAAAACVGTSAPEVLFCNSFLVTRIEREAALCLRWFKKSRLGIDISNCRGGIIVPVNEEDGCHWIYMHVSLTYKFVMCYNSSGPHPTRERLKRMVRNESAIESTTALLTVCRRQKRLARFFCKVVHETYVEEGWNFDYAQDYARQQDDVSCGVFMVMVRPPLSSSANGAHSSFPAYRQMMYCQVFARTSRVRLLLATNH